MIKIILRLIFFVCLVSNTNAQEGIDTSKPWTYWWWMGSAVNEQDIETQLQDFANAGFGGVHIIPIYGAKGYEAQFLPFLSEEWLEIVAFTINRAKQLQLGVDLTLGTGWPYGGPMVNENTAAKKLFVTDSLLNETDRIFLKREDLKLKYDLIEILAVQVSSKNTSSMYFMNNEKSIEEEVAKDNWQLTIFGIQNTGQKVKRAAPGGEGFVVDHFSKEAIDKYLSHFEEKLIKANFDVNPRVFYNDSYEVYRADWTKNFTHKFQELHGYALPQYLPLLKDTLHPNRPHFLHDIRATISEMLYNNFAKTWTSWSTKNGKLTRYQAHGSPANILDLYALADIPETESFGCSNFGIPGLNCDQDYREENFGRPSPLMMKFASSPANLLGKPFVSSETSTWLANHFKVSLSQIKPQIDELFIAGINHIFYHGATYSPANEAFPGWLFYASTNYNRQSHFWDELPLLNQYIQRCQQQLQAAKPDNRVLIFFPIDDLWTSTKGNILLLLDVHKYSKWFSDTDFGKTAASLWDNGYGYDYISDKQLEVLQLTSDKKLTVDGITKYDVLVFPPTKYLATTSLNGLNRLAEKGAKIIFTDDLPENEAGLAARMGNNSTFENLKTEIKTNDQVDVTNNLIKSLQASGTVAESMKVKGLDFIRKKQGEDFLYFVSNLSDRFYADTVELSVNAEYVILQDPLNGMKGYLPSNKFYLQLPPGKSIFVQTRRVQPALNDWTYFDGSENISFSKNEWQVNFIGGISESISNTFDIDQLTSWVDWGDTTLQTYCGKASYKTSFTLDKNQLGKTLKINFEAINESAEVLVNGTSCGTIWSLPYELEIPSQVLKEINELEIIIQNLSANLMRKIDKERPEWKKFYDINFVDITYKPFKAIDWDLEPSGLIGEVTLTVNNK